MRIAIVSLLFFASFASAQSETHAHPRWISNAGAGLVTTAPSAKIKRSWKHKVSESYAMGFGEHWVLPWVLPEIYFFAGPDFRYEKSVEEAGGESYIKTSYALLATAGVAWEPSAINTHIGFRLHTSLALWGKVNTKLRYPGFSHSINEKPDLWDHAGVGTYYKMTPKWWIFTQFEYQAPGSVVLIGANYTL